MKNVKHAKTSKAKKRRVAGVTTDSTHPQASGDDSCTFL